MIENLSALFEGGKAFCNFLMGKNFKEGLMHTSYNNSKQFLAEYKEEVRETIPEELPKEVSCFLDFVLENLFDDSLSVAEALQRCTIKSKNFTSRFSLYAGATPKQFILEHRTTAAQHLLLETKLTIAQISILTGFSSHSAFSKAFKNSTGGINPSVWRKKNSGKNSGKNSQKNSGKSSG